MTNAERFPGFTARSAAHAARRMDKALNERATAQPTHALSDDIELGWIRGTGFQGQEGDWCDARVQRGTSWVLEVTDAERCGAAGFPWPEGADGSRIFLCGRHARIMDRVLVDALERTVAQGRGFSGNVGSPHPILERLLEADQERMRRQREAVAREEQMLFAELTSKSINAEVFRRTAS